MALVQFDTIREVFDRVREADHGDGELLTRYRTKRDQEAFGSLVRRHGPMVLGVCRRVLRDTHAADDAFQATFLVLAKRADAIRPADRLAPWLYGVAYRTSLKARSRAFRQQQVEQQYATETGSRSQASSASSDETAAVLQVIDEQLNALPEKYREPLVLCALWGLNKVEAAKRLGLPEGTVSSRLARAREMLRDRLTRRGVVVPLAALGALLTADTLRAAVPLPLAKAAAGGAVGAVPVSATALTLSHEVLRSMTLLKLKTLCAVAIVLSLVGGGFGLYATSADDKKPTQQGEKPATKPDGQKKPGTKPNPNEQNGNNNQNGEGDKPKPEGEKPKPTKPADKKPIIAKFSGRVQYVSAETNTLSFVDERGYGPKHTSHSVAENTKVLIDGKEAKLADVPRGAIASFMAPIRLDGQAPQIRDLLWVTGPSLTGVIKQVDATGVTLDGKNAPRTFKLAANGKVTINGKDAQLADLKAGDKVTITLTTNESAALSISGGKSDDEKPVKPEKPGSGKTATFGGRIAAVDASAKTITVTGKGDQAVTAKLTADTKIVVDGKEAKLADVPKGAVAVLTVAAATDAAEPRDAIVLTVSGPTIGGSVKQVDATGITFANEKIGDRTFKLLPVTTVTINGKEAKAADLKVGDKVQVTLTTDESGALAIVSGEKPKPGGAKPKPESEEE
jgi:RNA polymerase sigma factor (sigma-70 family)